MTNTRENLQTITPDRCERLDGLQIRELDEGLRIAVANSRISRMRGLARLDSMPDSYGLLIPKCRSVHTFTMRFPLDLIWLDKNDEPIRVDRNVGPRRMRSCWRARSVVEINAGMADRFVSAWL